MLRLAVLGPPIVERDGVVTSFDTRKAVALLALLAVARTPRSRAGLAALLWPESDEARARSSLRRTLSVTAAGVGGALVVTRSTVELDDSTTRCDLWDFESLSSSGDPLALSRAARLYRDDFLAGFTARAGAEFDHWQEQIAEQERQRLSSLLSRLVETTVSTGELEAALHYARRWLALDVLHEPAHRAVMRLLAWSDQRTAALAQYRSCVRVLESELGVAPLAETTALYEKVLAGELAPPTCVVAAPEDTGPGPDGSAPRREAIELIGQDDVVGSLLESCKRAAETGGGVVVLTGPSGSGKTAVVEAASDHVARWGGICVAARCHRDEQWLELGCTTELLRSATSHLGDPGDALNPADLREVARLLPELSVPYGSALPPLGSPGAQVRFFRSVTTTLKAAICRGSPGLVAVDDAQHLDESSARLLSYLVRRPEDLGGLLVLTWQGDSSLSEVLQSALREAGRHGRVQYLEPRLFGVEEVAAVLAAHAISEADPAQLVGQTGGLPLLVLAYAETLRTGQESSDETRAGGDPSEVPLTAKGLLLERLLSVSQPAAQVIAAAAVLGGGCDAELLRVTSGRSAEEVADAIDQGLGRRLLVELPLVRGAPARYDFPYEALRHVAYGECGTARRRLLHKRAADALARRVKRPGGEALFGTVAGHLEKAGRGDEAAVWSYRAAERSLSLYAHEEALDHLRHALDLGYSPAETHAAIAEPLIALGSYREALDELERAAAAAESSEEKASEEVRATIEQRLAAVHDRLGAWQVAAAHIEAALELCTDDPVLRARLLADRALIAYRRADPEAREMCRLALLAAEATGDPRALAQARNVAGVLAGLAGDMVEAERLFRTSLLEAARLADPGPGVAALNNLARLLLEMGRSEEAVAAAEEALGRGLVHGDVHRVAALHSNLADVLHASGRSEESIAHLKQAAVGFSAVDADGETLPRIWTLVEW